jgi:hypothetical protein
VERAELIDLLVADWSRDERTREMYRGQLEKGLMNLAQFRAKGADIRLRRELREKAKHEPRFSRSQGPKPVHQEAAPVQRELPAEFDRKKIVSMSPAEIRHLTAFYGHEQVNARLALDRTLDG